MLTEKQRIEARKRRQARRRRTHRGNVLSRGLRATGHEIKRTGAFLGRSLVAGFEALGPVGKGIRQGLGWLGSTLVRLFRLGLAVVGAITAAVGRALVALDRIATPHRALIAVALVASALLAVSQFVDFRATEIGQPGYAGIEDIATAPRVDVATPTGSHSILLLIGSALAFGAIAGSVLTGRRSWGLVLASVGGVTVLVSLAVDLPNGLDLAEAGLSYSGVSAVLLSGFWLQLASGVALAAAGLLLPLNPAGDLPTRARAPRRAAPAGARRSPTVNGSHT